MHPATERVISAAQAQGVSIVVTEFNESTRTAVEAANAVGCTVGQIVKSLCFTVQGQPLIALVSGANQLDPGKLAAHYGVGKKQIQRADADTVRAATGFAIGGVAPYGHSQPLPIFLDADLLTYDLIWAAAGTPNTVFPILPADLQRTTAAIVLDLKQ
jgi:Cys-tRNA(Pro) deacylase